MAAAKKSSTTKKTTAKKAPAKKTTAKRAPAKKAPAKAVAAAPEAAPVAAAAPVPAPVAQAPAAVPAPPPGFTWSLDQATGNLILVPTAEAAQEAAAAKEEVARNTISGKTIRNLRHTPVHFRFSGHGDKPYRVELMPRRMAGDTADIPAACTQDTTFIKSYRMGLFEIISKQEAMEQAAEFPVGSFRTRELDIVSPDQTTVAHFEIEEQGHGKSSKLTRNDFERQVQSNVPQQSADPYQGATVYESVGPRVVGMPGSDPQLTAQFQATQARRPSPQEVAAMQQATGRAEHAPNKLVDKGVMPPMPQVAGIQRVQGM